MIVSKSKTLRDFIEMAGDDYPSVGDICLASFLIAHGFPDTTVSIGSIGSIPREEALALNAMLPSQATFVVLTGDTLSYHRTYLSDIVSEIEASGFAPRLQFADLTLPNRWPHILAAMASSEIGVLGIDARWAAAHPSFWHTLQNFMETGRVLVYVRDMLDYRHPELAIALIRAMPADYALSVIATTPRSVWFAGTAVQGASTRDFLRSCGMFQGGNSDDADGSPESPVVVTDGSALRQIDVHGRLPRVVITTTEGSSGLVEYHEGWSSAEADGCWTAAPDATLRVMLPPRSAAPNALAITGNSWIPPSIKDQVIAIGIGHEPITWTEMNFIDPEEILTATLDIKDVTYDPSAFVIRVKVQTPGRPSDFGGSDTRLLGFKMRAIAIFT